MGAPPHDAPVRLRLKCPDAQDFVARFAPNVTRGGVFLPTHHARAVGASIRFEIALVNNTVAFAGHGIVIWVKAKGMGVKFTALDAASEPMLERLLSRRAGSAPVAAGSSATASASKAKPATEVGAMPVSTFAQEISAALKPGPSSSAVPATSQATELSLPLAAPGPRRPLVRVAVVASVVFVIVAVVWMSVGRARVGTAPSGQPAKPPATVASPAPAVPAPAAAEHVAAPPAPIAAPPSEAPPAPVAASPATVAPTQPAPGAGAGAVQVESILVSTAYKNFTCPDPARRISVRSSKTVNVCLQVAHRQGKSDRLTLVWERGGAFAGKTPVEIPASKPTVRTRVHMKISANRLGPWSVRVVGNRNAPLAQTDFEVVP